MLRDGASVVFVLFAIACSGRATDQSEPPWTTTVATAGDTTVIRTSGVRENAALRQLVAESSIGTTEGDTADSFGQISDLAIGPTNDVLVFDRQPPSLRHFDSAGTFVRTIGRSGQGPGEYIGANGLKVHRDGRIALWDEGNRVNFYAPTGELITSSAVPGGGGFRTNGWLFVDTLGNTYIRARVASVPGENPRAERNFGLLRYDPRGGIVDSLRPPRATIDPVSLTASSNGNLWTTLVPFTPQFLWTFSPHGHFVSARSDAYAIDLTNPDGGVKRVEMEATRIPVSSVERNETRAWTEVWMRMNQPDWRWTGADIPDVKPYLTGISVASDGRIWAMISRPAAAIPAAEQEEQARMLEARRNDPALAGHPPPPVQTVREPTVYDVFEADGQYLGRVPLPDRTSWRAARGDLVWAIVWDSLDVERVTRFRVTPGLLSTRTPGTGARPR
jgi:hypothetical protein